MKMSASVATIGGALAAVQATLDGAKKDSTNPHFKSKYADLESCWRACRKQLAEAGIAVLQPPKPSDGGVTIETLLVHKSGEWIADEGLFVPADRNNAQGFGSAMTYARRYSLCAMVGIAPEDDDGNAASNGEVKKPTAKQVAAEHGMKTGDQIAQPTRTKPGATAYAKLAEASTWEQITKLIEWVKAQRIKDAITKEEYHDLDPKCAAKAVEIAPPGCEQCATLLRTMAGELRFTEEQAAAIIGQWQAKKDSQTAQAA